MRGAALAVIVAMLGWTGGAGAAVEVEARLSRSRIAVGEATSLEVVVRGGAAGVGEPEFALPAGLELLGSGRAQNFTWINGKSTVEIVHRFELAAGAAGRYAIGPIIVRAGREVFRSGVLTLEASAAATRVGGGGSGAASLLVDVTPAEPWQGQPCQMRVRLIQRSALAEDPQYEPPSTPGFWTDKPTAPESYYADERGQRVLVTETRTRLFPLAAGVATVGEASATLALPTGTGDPMDWLAGRVPRREEIVRSRPVPVRVRALPGGAPSGFTGAVGNLAVLWSADRVQTTVDVPITLRLDVRGIGNLPLMRPPELAGVDLEVFASTMDDSLPAGGDGGGRRRFQWTVLARRPGRITIAPPAFSWFDPSIAGYRRVDAAPVRVEVGAALIKDAGDGAAMPQVFTRHPTDPGARPARAWGWALAGLLLAAGVAVWRSAPAGGGRAAERARVLEWMRAVGRVDGPDFWRAADEAALWLESQGAAVDDLRRQIASHRYAGSGGEIGALRSRLVEALRRALPPALATGMRRAVAAGLAVVAVAGCLWSAPRSGDVTLRSEARAADRMALDGDRGGARGVWARAWDAGARHPGLAARLAWIEAQSGAIGAASAWVLRGEALASRDPALNWVAERVREGGGLVGESRTHLPVSPLEWGMAAFLLGGLAGLLWPAWRRVAVVLALVALCGVMDPAQRALVGRIGRAVIVTPVTLEGEGLELQAGQVVRVGERRGGKVRVDAGAGAVGWVPAETIDIVGGGR